MYRHRVGYFTMSNHSLTHCCAWPAEGRSVLHIERSWPAIQAAPTDKPMSNGIFKFNFLAVVVSKISRDPQIVQLPPWPDTQLLDQHVSASYKQLSSMPSAFCCAWRPHRSTDEDVQPVTVHAALRSLGRQHEMCYLPQYATTNSLPCHFIASWRLNYTLEYIFLFTLARSVTVFTVRVSEHNFIVLTYLGVLTYIRGPCVAWTPPSGLYPKPYPKRVLYHI